jgi:hypothetical protein
MSPADTVHLLEAVVSDFAGLKDVAAETARVKELSKQPEVKKALARQRADDDAEARMQGEILELEAGLSDESRRNLVLMQLRERLSKMSGTANTDDDSPTRSQARRVLRAITAGAADRVQDREYRALIDQYGLRGR